MRGRETCLWQHREESVSTTPPRVRETNGLAFGYNRMCKGAQRPHSTSHVRMVESNPQLTAFPPPGDDDLTTDTCAVCERCTAEGSFVLPEPPSSCTLRRFLRSGPVTVSSGTSSASGMLVDHSPMSQSQPAVRMYFPSRVDYVRDRCIV